MDIDPERLGRATRLGADRTVNSQTGEGTLPEHPDLVIEASGAPGQLGVAIHMVRPGGRVLAVGMPADPAEIDGHHLVFNEITLDSSVALVIEEDLRDALEMLATTPIASELLDSVRPLERMLKRSTTSPPERSAAKSCSTRPADRIRRSECGHGARRTLGCRRPWDSGRSQVPALDQTLPELACR